MRLLLNSLIALCLASAAGFAAQTPTPFDLKSGDRVVFVGDTLIEREQSHGWVELMLTTRFANQDITFRNLGWSADTPAGDSRFGLSLLQAGREPADEGWKQLVKQLEDAKPTVVFVGYGMASSFEGAAGLTKFKRDYARLLDAIQRISPGVRLVLFSPIRHENLGAPWPDGVAHNAQLALYSRAVGEIATARQATFVSLFDIVGPALAAEPSRGARDNRDGTPASGGPTLTDNGIHLTHRGYRSLAETLEDALFGAEARGAWRTSAQTEPLRQAILRKNEWFFHRSRPANMAYIFGFRKREQGNNAIEIAKMDALVAAEEKRIAALRALRPANVPENPRRVGNLAAKFTAQPHPKFHTADGLEITLWAENPLLNKPLQMNFDPQGRLWVVSSELYPQIEPGQAATDKVIVLEDTQGDGRADKATVFADGLLIPTGIEVGDGGAYVAQSTELLHFKDTDGDGKADTRRTVLSGFGTEDTHHNLHTLRWGPDGRLHMNQAVYTRTDTETPHGVVRLKAGGVFRFDPRDQRMEILYRGLINGWGHQFDDFGQSFLTDGAGFQGVNWGIPGATYRTLAPARRELQSVSPGTYPKFCGIEIIRSTMFPADWQGDVVTADFRAHRIVRFKLSDQGSGFVTKEMPDVLRTTADSFRPIDLRMGPDGALYIADWSNPIIQHGEVDFRDPRRDKAHGRIWRVAVKGAKPQPRIDFASLGNAALFEHLLSPNGYAQERAKRVLVERGAAKVLPELDTWTANQTGETAKLQALWMYQALSSSPPRERRDDATREAVPALPSRATELLTAKDPRVRAAAVRVAPSESSIEALAKLVADEHPRVRLAAVRALGNVKTLRAAELALSVLSRPMDPFLDYALWLTINELAEPWIAAVKSGAWAIAGRESQLEFALKAIEPALASEVLGLLVAKQGIARDGSGPWIELIGAAGGAKELRVLFDPLLRGELADAAALRAFRALDDAARLRSAKPTGELGGIAALLEAKNESLRTAAIKLAGTWKLRAIVPNLVRLAGGADTPAAERAAAFAALREIGGSAVVAALKKLAQTGTTAAAGRNSSERPGTAAVPGADTLAIRREAAVTLASLELPSAVPEVIAVLKATTDEARAQTLWRSLLGIRGMSARLANELPKTELPREVARAGLRPAREGNQHQALVPVLLKAAGLALSNVQLTTAEMQKLASEALAKGDAVRGEHIYRRPELACVACHAIGGAGGKVGPDLTSIGASAQPDYLVESLLYPSAKIKEGYHSAMIATKDGQEHSGMIAKETATEVLLRDATNKEISIPVQAIARRTSVGSLMPAGLVDTLLPDERLDLIKFMAQLGKPGDFDAAKGGVARAWKLYLVVSQNQHLGVERVIAADFTLKDWVPAFSLVSGALSKPVIDAAIPPRTNTRGLFAATQFTSAKGDTARFAASGEVTGVWVNGVELKAAPEFTANVKPDLNSIVLRLDETKMKTGTTLRSGDVTFSTEEPK